MGVMLERSGLAEDLLEAMGRLFGARPGGLAIAVVLVGVLLAAAKGIVGATVVTMGLIVLPTMLRHGYNTRLAAGTVAATGTLAQIFPPATVLILLGDQISNAFAAAQLAKGSIVPALALVLLYLIYLMAHATLWPKSSPPIPPDPAAPRGIALARRLLAALVAPLALILVVLGSILGGVATPTESASIGAVGAMLLAARRSGLRTFAANVHAHRSARRHRRRRPPRHACDVPARIRDGRVRDHFRGGADRRAGAAGNAGR
jgi:TRAP-type mannitol/chloroaromatic compound transport system permease large subunit